MSFLKDIIDKQRLKKCLELLKSHVATSVNGQKPDKNGAVNIGIGVESVDGITPDEAGNVKIPVASDEEVAAGETNEKYMTPANTLFAINKRTANYYNSAEAMKADKKLKAGMTAQTLGYYSPNDGGGGTYIIRAKVDGDVDDGGSLHELANGNVAELVVENGTVNVKQFGAKGDGVTDDSERIQKAANKYSLLFIPNGTFLLTNPVDINKAKSIKGNDKHESLIIGVFNFTKCYGLEITDLGFTSTNDEYNDSGIKGVFSFCVFKNLYFRKCRIAMDFAYGTWINDFSGIQILYCDIGINTPDQFNSISFQGSVQRTNVCFQFNNQARKIVIYDSDFEGNNTVFKTHDIHSFSLMNSYLEYNETFFEFTHPFFSSYAIIENCYFYGNGETLTDGWLVKIPSVATSDVNNTIIRFVNNKITIAGETLAGKPFLITGNKAEYYGDIGIKDNYLDFPVKPQKYTDLFAAESNQQLNFQYSSLESDLPMAVYDNLYWYFNYNTIKNARYAKKVTLQGYININQTGSAYLTLEGIVDVIVFPSRNFIGMCDVVYNDGSVERMPFEGEWRSLYLKNLNPNKTTSKVVFNITYTIGG